MAVSKQLWLARHGATDWSDAGLLTGWTDLSLNERGRRQALGIRDQLVSTRFNGVWSSDLRRARETAAIAGVRAVCDRRLRELDFGELEGRRWEDHPPRVRDALLDFDRLVATGGESVADLRNRVLEFVSDLPVGTHFIFTHGGVIRALTGTWAAPGTIVALGP